MNLLYVVVGMALVTYLPRLLPFLMQTSRQYPPKVRLFLNYLPYAILGALIFPGVLSSTGDTISALVGLLTAFALAWLRAPLIAVVAGAILAVAVTVSVT